MSISRAKLLALLSITLTLLSPALSTVGKISTIEDGSLRANDVMAIDFNTLFNFQRADMTKLNFEVTQTDGVKPPSSLGKVYSGID